jgi:hypothetical protein
LLSSDPSDSDPSSTDSSSNEARHWRHGHKNKASQQAKPKSKGQQEEKKFFGNDPLVGNCKWVHDLPINGKEIDKAAGPPDMRSKDSAKLWNVAVDVTALPGMFINIRSGGGDNIDDKAQQTTKMAATLIATVIGKRAQIHDSLWKTQKRHSLGQVKSMEGLFKFVESVAKSEESTFEQQENALQVFMLPRHYDETVICEYVQNGFLPRLTLEAHPCSWAFWKRSIAMLFMADTTTTHRTLSLLHLRTRLGRWHHFHSEHRLWNAYQTRAHLFLQQGPRFEVHKDTMEGCMPSRSFDSTLYAAHLSPSIFNGVTPADVNPPRSSRIQCTTPVGFFGFPSNAEYPDTPTTFAAHLAQLTPWESSLFPYYQALSHPI